MSTALSPDGKYLLVLNGGYKPPSISVIELATTRELGRMPVPDGWLGLTFVPKGNLVYVGGGSQAAVFEFSFAAGKLTPRRKFPVVPEKKRTERDFVGDVVVSPDGRLIYAAELYRNSVAVINPQSGRVIERFQTGRRPYRILFHPDGKSLFVTSWADGRVLHHEAENGNLLSTVRLTPHPTDMVWRPGKPEPDELEEGPVTYVARLFVAAANTNTVHVIGVSESKDLQAVESINVSLTPRQPAGMTPSALALNADHSRLFVACSDANAVAVVDVSKSRSRVLGFVPTGWYPTSVRSLAGGRLAVLNGKGLRSFPNPKGQDPAKIQTGAASFIDPFNNEELEAYSKTVLANSPYRDTKLYDAGTGADSPIPAWPGGPSPIRHVIYIVKENRTYDQVLGDMKEGNGDRSLVLFGEEVTPNHHKLAREFVLLDNFYVNGDGSIDGYHWSAAAIASDYVQKLWPASYRIGRSNADFYGATPASHPPAGYLWTNAAAAGLSMRNYGHFVVNRAKPAADGIQVESVKDSVLRQVTNRYYRGFDLDYPDVERARAFLRDLAEFEKGGAMPRLVLMRLGNDHTSGRAPGSIAPRSAVADNDYALGMIVEAVSKSRFWPTTAIFVVEDGAQDGADHVDSHRSPAFVISPYVKRRSVDSTMYNTTSVLRTMELILGLHPMTHFDAAARPMSTVFQATPDLRPYAAETPRISLKDRNPNDAASAALIAYEELLIAEGSDWCWWYGPEHDSVNRPEFDRLYRDHLANVYRSLGRTPPDWRG
jgi:YVTN family beta-propeller protein